MIGLKLIKQRLSINIKMTAFSCSAIHHNIRIQGNYQSGLKIIPCCVYRTKNNYTTLEEYFSSAELQQLKLSTTWPSGCDHCKKQEDAAQTSNRMLYEKLWESSASRDKIRFEIFPSNVCNLKCIMCKPDNSTALAQERYNLGLGNFESVQEFEITNASIKIMSSIPPAMIDSVCIIGGEFFLSKGNLDILDFVIDKNVPLRVVTNATVILPAHLERLKKIKVLDLQISIDGIEESYEFMRYPARWNTVLNNIKIITNDLKGQQLNFNYVVQLLNVQNLLPSLAVLNRFRIPTRITNLVEPDYLSWSVLNSYEKNDLIKNLQQQIQQHAVTRQQKEYVTNLCSTLEASVFDPHLRHEFVSRVGDTLALRKLSHDKIQSQFGIFTELATEIKQRVTEKNPESGAG